jgi:hypothetical protein
MAIPKNSVGFYDGKYLINRKALLPGILYPQCTPIVTGRRVK